VIKKASVEALYGGWPMVIVQQLRKVLPQGYVAGPRVHLGAQIEIDVNVKERDGFAQVKFSDADSGGVATATWVAPPSLHIETDLTNFDEYEVRVYDAERGRQLVAAIEIVSPANKDRPEKRNAFVGKCAALLQRGVAVSIIDLVTIRQFNLYAEPLSFIGHSDPTLPANPPAIYAATCRWLSAGKHNYLDTWPSPLEIGKPLPEIPLWLADSLVVPLDLEQSYEQACRDLWIA
jgi:hypothetical protein